MDPDLGTAMADLVQGAVRVQLLAWCPEKPSEGVKVAAERLRQGAGS